MNQGTYPLAASMINQLNRVDTIANNLANANTIGYKQTGMTEGTFNNYLDKAREKNSKTTEMNVLTNSVPKLNSTYTNQEMGSHMQTGNKLDFALKQEDAFFKVQNPNGEQLLTRDGSFKIVNNLLVTSENYPVLSADNEPITVEEGIDFSEQIGVVLTDFENLQKVGKNNYHINDFANTTNFQGDNSNYILQGTLEQSNVNSITSMVALIDAHRRFEQAQKAVQGIDDINAKVIEKLGAK